MYVPTYFLFPVFCLLLLAQLLPADCKVGEVEVWGVRRRVGEGGQRRSWGDGLNVEESISSRNVRSRKLKETLSTRLDALRILRGGRSKNKNKNKNKNKRGKVKEAGKGKGNKARTGDKTKDTNKVFLSIIRTNVTHTRAHAHTHTKNTRSCSLALKAHNSTEQSEALRSICSH